jgi:hypothetical protein
VSFGLGHIPAELGSHGLAELGVDEVAGILEFDVGTGEIEHAAVRVIESGSEIGEELALQNEAQAAGREIIALITEGAGVCVGKDFAESSPTPVRTGSAIASEKKAICMLFLPMRWESETSWWRACSTAGEKLVMLMRGPAVAGSEESRLAAELELPSRERSSRRTSGTELEY